VGVIKALEEALNRPILTANQVAFWQALVLMGSGARIVDYGQVFSVKR
jgi:maleate isomerase